MRLCTSDLKVSLESFETLLSGEYRTSWHQRAFKAMARAIRLDAKPQHFAFVPPALAAFSRSGSNRRNMVV